MSLNYRAIDWNRQKKIYDVWLAGIVLMSLLMGVGVSLFVRPNLTAETLVIRATGVTAFALLHVILAIGPMARLDGRFLPLLYNRRHLGVTMFLLALVHGVFTTVQFHALGNEWPWVSLWTAYSRDFVPVAGEIWNVANIPFEPFGVVALALLFLMAATSHDFWLKNLGASFWKALHMGVYLAYGLLLAHVGFGVLQSERHMVLAIIVAFGAVCLTALHLASGIRERRRDSSENTAPTRGFVDACGVGELEEGRAVSCGIRGKRVAVWKHQGRVYATSGVCRHQGGPLAEGRILDGCITCPWHGWNYRPEDGCSPPPFKEVIDTYPVEVVDGRVRVGAAPKHVEDAASGTPKTAVKGGAHA